MSNWFFCCGRDRGTQPQNDIEVIQELPLNNDVESKGNHDYDKEENKEGTHILNKKPRKSCIVCFNF